MKRVSLSGELIVPAIGQGTWRMGENADRWSDEVASLQRGIERGMTVIDTAELYGNGRSERLVGEAVAGRRDHVTLVSKVMPSNASREGTIRACEASLERLKTDRIDLYLLHWPGSTPLAETVEAFEDLEEAGKICEWGISNFDRDDVETAFSAGDIPKPAVNQLYYSLRERGIEYRYLDWMSEQGIAVMAYTPFGQDVELFGHPVLKRIADRHHAAPSQIALAFVIRGGKVVAIPKASRIDHTEENAGAGDLVLTDEDLAELDAAFPPPRRQKPLAII